jgi:hypothetical protein
MTASQLPANIRKVVACLHPEQELMLSQAQQELGDLDDEIGRYTFEIHLPPPPDKAWAEEFGRALGGMPYRVMSLDSNRDVAPQAEKRVDDINTSSTATTKTTKDTPHIDEGHGE